MNESFMRNIAFPLKEKLTGGRTLEHLKELERSQWYPLERIRALQWEQLQSIISLAGNDSPYYRESFARAGFTHSTMQGPADLLRIPLLSREDVRDHLDSMVPVSHRGRLIPIRTGGSSGHPLKFYLDRPVYQFLNAIHLRSLGWWGIQIGDRWVDLWGSSGAFNPSGRARLLSRLGSAWPWLLNHRRISAYDISDASLARYASMLQSFRPRILHSYASSAFHFARYLLEQGQDLGSLGLRAVVCTAEPLYPFQRKAIKAAFGCPAVNEYGSSEGGLYAFECPQGSMHLLAENVYVEFLKDGRPVGPEEPGEIVVTTLRNNACPLIRYRVGDVGSYSVKSCPCGRGLPLLASLEGREHDTIVGTDGRIIHGEMFTHIMEYTQGVARFQVIQKSLWAFQLLVVPGSTFEPMTLKWATDKMKEMLGDSVEIDVQMHDTLPPDSAGKFRWIVSHLRAAAPPSTTDGRDQEQ